MIIMMEAPAIMAEMVLVMTDVMALVPPGIMAEMAPALARTEAGLANAPTKPGRIRKLDFITQLLTLC